MDRNSEIGKSRGEGSRGGRGKEPWDGMGVVVAIVAGCTYASVPDHTSPPWPQWSLAVIPQYMVVVVIVIFFSLSNFFFFFSLLLLMYFSVLGNLNLFGTWAFPVLTCVLAKDSVWFSSHHLLFLDSTDLCFCDFCDFSLKRLFPNMTLITIPQRSFSCCEQPDPADQP